MINQYCIDNLLEDLDEVYKHFLFARSLTPYFDEKTWEIIIQENREIETAPLYKNCGFNSKISLDNININFNDWFSTGSWINRSFFIHLYAMLDNLCVVKYLDKCLQSKADREKDIWVLFKNLRHVFVHSSKYKDMLKKQTDINYRTALRLQKKLYALLCYKAQDINLSIDEFIIPFYSELRNVLINNLSEFESFQCNKDGEFIGFKTSKT